MKLSRNPITYRRQIASEILQGATAQAGGTILVDGLSGMGKTYFLRELAFQARQDKRWTVTFLSADRIEASERYSFLERFFAAGIAPDWDFETESKKQPLALARSCVRHLVDTQNPKAPGHFILIDDIQWIDEDSARVLRHLIPRVNRRNVVFACAARSPHAESSLAEFLAQAATTNPQDQRFEIEPLEEQEILALALERFGMTISRNIASELREVTGGSFLGVDSIFSQVTPEEIEQLHLTWEFPIRRSDVENPMLGIFQELTPKAQQIAQIICLAEHELSRQTLTAAAQTLQIPNAIDEVVQSGIIRESGFGRSLVPQHELIGAAIRNTVDGDFARQVYRVLADLTSGFRSVWHRFHGAETWGPELHEHVKKYVAEASDQLQFNNVIDILRMALDLTADPAVRQELITDLVIISIRAKSGYQCLDLLAEIETFPYSMLREFLILMLRVYQVDATYPEDRVTEVLQTPCRTPDEAALQGFLLFTLVMVLMRSEQRDRIPDLLPAARAFMARGPQHAADVADSRLAWMIAPQEYFVLLDCIEIVLADLEQDAPKVRAALPALTARVKNLPPDGLKVDAITMLAGVTMAVGETQAAHQLASEAVELLDRGVTESWSSATPRIIQAHTLLLLGHYREAHLALDHFDEISHDTLDLEARLTGAALRAKLLSITQGEDPDLYIAQAKRLWDFHWEHYGRDLSIMAKVEHARATGKAQEILDITASTPLRQTSTTMHGFLTYRVHTLIDLGHLEEARALVADLAARRGRSWYEHWGSLAWLQARLAQASGDFKQATELYKSARQEQTYPLTWALTSQDYGAFLMDQRDYTKAIHILQQTVTKLEELGAAAYLPRARELLATASQQNQVSHTDVLESMTQREHEVAELLAEGLSNKAIATKLVVSQSTVRFHVSNILRKLQLDSRSEVAMALHDSLQNTGFDEPPNILRGA